MYRVLPWMSSSCEAFTMQLLKAAASIFKMPPHRFSISGFGAWLARGGEGHLILFSFVNNTGCLIKK